MQRLLITILVGVNLGLAQEDNALKLWYRQRVSTSDAPKARNNFLPIAISVFIRSFLRLANLHKARSGPRGRCFAFNKMTEGGRSASSEAGNAVRFLT